MLTRQLTIPTDSLGYLMGKAHFAMRRSMNRRLFQSGLSISSEQCIVLISLGEEKNLRQQDLANRLSKDKTGISRIVCGMEKLGLVERNVIETDRRNFAVNLTKEGESILSLILDQVYQVHSNANKGISKEDIDVCKRVLNKIMSNLEEYEGVNIFEDEQGC